MRIGIVADDQKQRLALRDAVDRLGLVIKDSLTLAEVMATDDLVLDVDVWLVDVDNYSTDLENKLSPEGQRLIIGFEPAPHISHSELYERWQKYARRNLVKLLNINPEPQLHLLREPVPWRYVVFLGASMGGIDAVKAFLDTLSPDLPVAVLLAQHYDETMLESVPKIISRQNDWRCRIVRATQSLQSGICLIAPINKKIICDSTGRVILSHECWADGYRPNIGALLKNTSEVFGNQMIGIILSGMGNDGSQHAHELTANGSLLWAQDPSSAQSPSQPQAFIDTGICQYVGTPAELAQKINDLLKQMPE